MERDKFLTEAMGECWHKMEKSNGLYVCDKCNTTDICELTFNNFSTPNGFFKLWNWAKEQEWWENWKWSNEYRSLDGTYIMDMEWFIHPDRFADAIYDFLKERENG